MTAQQSLVHRLSEVTGLHKHAQKVHDSLDITYLQCAEMCSNRQLLNVKMRRRCLCFPGKQRKQHREVCGAGPGLSDGLASPVLGELAEGLETPVQALYLVTLLGFLVVGAYLVVRQVRIQYPQSHISLGSPDFQTRSLADVPAAASQSLFALILVCNGLLRNPSQ